jgi:DNA-binding transcriptional ArsR family regulator
MPPPPRTSAITDVAALRTLTHPIRIRLYELLSALGPSTATMLAGHVDQAVSLLSYHLRQLEEHGLVEQAPELAIDGRERWWRVVPGGIHWSPADFLDDPAGKAVVASAERQLLARQLDRLQQYSASQGSWGRDWVDAATSTDALFQMTPDELRAFNAEVQEVAARWAARDLPDDGAARAHVFYFLHSFPITP